MGIRCKPEQCLTQGGYAAMSEDNNSANLKRNYSSAVQVPTTISFTAVMGSLTATWQWQLALALFAAMPRPPRGGGGAKWGPCYLMACKLMTEQCEGPRCAQRYHRHMGSLGMRAPTLF